MLYKYLTILRSLQPMSLRLFIVGLKEEKLILTLKPAPFCVVFEDMKLGLKKSSQWVSLLVVYVFLIFITATNLQNLGVVAIDVAGCSGGADEQYEPCVIDVFKVKFYFTECQANIFV